MVRDLYVQAPAYRDLELVRPCGAVRQAARPERLRVRVMWQRGTGELLPPTSSPSPGSSSTRSTPRAAPAQPAVTQISGGLARGAVHPAARLAPSLRRRLGRAGAGRCSSSYGRAGRRSRCSRPTCRRTTPPATSIDRPGRTGSTPTPATGGVLTRLKSGADPRTPSCSRSPCPPTSPRCTSCWPTGGSTRTCPFDPEVYFFGDEVLTERPRVRRGLSAVPSAPGDRLARLRPQPPGDALGRPRGVRRTTRRLAHRTAGVVHRPEVTCRPRCRRLRGPRQPLHSGGAHDHDRRRPPQRPRHQCRRLPRPCRVRAYQRRPPPHLLVAEPDHPARPEQTGWCPGTRSAGPARTTD